MKVGEIVKLVTFKGKIEADEEVDSSEDYWKLIGKVGTVQQSPNEKTIYASFSSKPRVLVRFDKDLLQSYGLTAHNDVENSLWILESDLESIDK